jgi:hypothetical protein
MIGRVSLACLIVGSTFVTTGFTLVFAEDATQPVVPSDEAKSKVKDESTSDSATSGTKTEIKEEKPEDKSEGSQLPAPAEAKSSGKNKKEKTPKTIAEAIKLINQKLNGIQRLAKQMEGECYRADTAMSQGQEVTGGFGMVIPLSPDSASGSQNYQAPRPKQIRQYAKHIETNVSDIQELLTSIVIPEDRAALLNPMLDQLKSSIAAVQQHQNNVSGNLNAMEIARGTILSEAHFFQGVTNRVREDGDKLSKAASKK